MRFTPVVPFSGYAGWRFLGRTREAQETAFAASPEVQRSEAYFRERIGSITTAEDLVADRRLLQVALDAFGLGDDIDNRFFIRKVLEDGTLSADALANKLSDKRYLAFSKAFGFGDYATPRTVLSDFPDTILAQYEVQKFEQAVGEQNEDMRLAMNAERELAGLSGRAISDDAKWFTVMGSAPLRTVFQTALGLPSGFVALDLDQQLATLRERSEAVFGGSEVARFSDPDKVETLVRLYLVRSEVAANASVYSAQATALTLLQSSQARSGRLSRLV